MENKFTIGQMAKLHNMSVKTLRYYDEIDLFKPVEVDPHNGYRYYSVEQFKLLDIINYLKILGVPLKDIKKHTVNRDLKEFIISLREHLVSTEQKIAELQLIKRKLTERIKEIENVNNISDIGKPFVQTIEERHIIRLEERIHSHYDLEISLRKLGKQIQQFASIFIGKVGLTISENYYKQGHFFDYGSIFIILEEVEKGQFMESMDFVTTLSKGEYACIYFRGGHDQAPYYFEILDKYIQKQDYHIIGDFMIRTIIDQFISNRESEFLSEIQVKVATIN